MRWQDNNTVNNNNTDFNPYTKWQEGDRLKTILQLTSSNTIPNKELIVMLNGTFHNEDFKCKNETHSSLGSNP